MEFERRFGAWRNTLTQRFYRSVSLLEEYLVSCAEEAFLLPNRRRFRDVLHYNLKTVRDNLLKEAFQAGQPHNLSTPERRRGPDWNTVIHESLG